MSSGEARRMVIARALVHRPQALVLDEPTNSLDFHAMRGLRAAMSRIAQGGTGLILVTHHLDDIVSSGVDVSEECCGERDANPEAHANSEPPLS
jgi:ABC-type molybdenum transport system ATPase subunit/photorepair protein PhrA